MYRHTHATIANVHIDNMNTTENTIQSKTTPVPPFCVMYRTQGRAWYPLFSMIFRYLTWMPDVVKYGISNLTWIGGRPSSSSAQVGR